MPSPLEQLFAGHTITYARASDIPVKPAGFESKKHNEAVFYTIEGGQKYAHIMGVKIKCAEKPYKYQPSLLERTSFSTTALELLRQIAVSYTLKIPINIMGDSGIGKTMALKVFSEIIGAQWHLAPCTEDTTVKKLKISANFNEATQGFTYTDGPITQAMRAGEGEIHVLILDEVNTMRSEQATGLHNVIDEWKHNGHMSTDKPIPNKDPSKPSKYEMIPINNDRTFIAMTANPPEGNFFGRKPIDEAMQRRTHTTIHVRNDVLETLEHHAHLEGSEEGVKLAHERFLYSRSTPISLADIRKGDEKTYEGLKNAYTKFHAKVNSLLKSNELAKDQEGKPHFGNNEMPARVWNFVRAFYTPQNGSLEEILQKALMFFYIMPFQHEDDRARVYNMILAVTGEERKATTPLPKAVAALGAANREQFPTHLGIKTREEAKADIARAEKILGAGKVMGPDQIEAAFGISVESLPPIPFSDKELKRARANDMVLILRINTITKANKARVSLNAQTLKNIATAGFAQRGAALFTNEVEFMQSVKDVASETPRVGWVLVDTAPIGRAAVKGDGLVLQDAAMSRVSSLFKNLPTKLATKYMVLLGEYHYKGYYGDRVRIQASLNDATDKYSSKSRKNAYASDAANALSISRGKESVQVTRQSISEFLYDSMLYYIVTGQSLGGTAPIVTGSLTNGTPEGLAAMQFDSKKGYTFKPYDVRGGYTYANYATLASLRGA